MDVNGKATDDMTLMVMVMNYFFQKKNKKVSISGSRASREWSWLSQS
jgi:hypothetical protein